MPVAATPLFEDVTSFPEVREDLAVIVGQEVAAADVLDVVRRAGAPLLARAEVFDVYRDEQRLGAGNVSLALRLAYRALVRSLRAAVPRLPDRLRFLPGYQRACDRALRSTG